MAAVRVVVGAVAIVVSPGRWWRGAVPSAADALRDVEDERPAPTKGDHPQPEVSMLIRANFALTLDGFSATADGRPAILAMPGVRPGISYDTRRSSPSATPSPWAGRRSSRR
jgi:hypothetical protein